MKFTVPVKDLAQALSRISSAIPQRSPMPVLENVLLQLEGSILSLTATDMDITMTTTLEVRGERNARCFFRLAAWWIRFGHWSLASLRWMPT